MNSRGREEALRSATDEATSRHGKVHEATVRLRTAEESLGTDKQVLLQRKTQLVEKGERLATRIRELSDQLTDAKVAVQHAEDTLDRHEESRAAAETKRDTALGALWETFGRGIA
ncbi:hypothetical protein NONO_c37670 [Nocardia nova SH22a]|uniref:Uncharacterized protein n=1 Tax=Nocardia nova SH22a TaxID=1415166 RepID=W5TMT7_9NOCA|nr:hypothetical protein [Nocardia nova]AHH18551.1 hypothetical protein NONO_c37670 [Nocardia nova SH22a]